VLVSEDSVERGVHWGMEAELRVLLALRVPVMLRGAHLDIDPRLPDGS
jgi:hypothetical protein